MTLLETAPVFSDTEMAAQLSASRAETDRLFNLVSSDNMYARPLPQRHRLIFYLGHLEAFDWNQVGRMALGESHVNPSFERLFERGIDPEPGQLPSDQQSDWPSLAEARAYVNEVRERLDRIWRHADPAIRQTAVEHRWMHAETLTYQLHNLPHELKRRPDADTSLRLTAPRQNDFVRIPAGIATLGRKPEHGFGWDNEFHEFTVDVPAFSVSRFKITNGEYLKYVQQGHAAPFFWTKIADEWYYRGMFEMTKLPLDAPVYVTQREAADYAAWHDAGLMSESQFHRAAFGSPDGREQNSLAPAGNFNLRHWDPVSVTAYPESASPFGVAQLIGNGWEWTATPFEPFSGFAAQSNYPGYSADFFDNQHFVLKGASPRTAAALTRRSFRNWFRPDYPYLYATFRLVKNDKGKN